MVDEQRVVAMEDAQMTKHNTDGELKTIERRVYLYLPIPLQNQIRAVKDATPLMVKTHGSTDPVIRAR